MDPNQALGVQTPGYPTPENTILDAHLGMNPSTPLDGEFPPQPDRSFHLAMDFQGTSAEDFTPKPGLGAQPGSGVLPVIPAGSDWHDPAASPLALRGRRFGSRIFTLDEQKRHFSPSGIAWINLSPGRRKEVERATGFEPATSSLGSSHSTN